MSTMYDYQNNVDIQWCPGCPNFGILQAFKKALVELNIGVIYRMAPAEVFAGRFRKAVTDRPLPELQPPGGEKMLKILSGFRAA